MHCHAAKFFSVQKSTLWWCGADKFNTGESIFKDKPELAGMHGMHDSIHETDSSTIPFEHTVLDIAISSVIKRLRRATDELYATRGVVEQLTCSVDRETLVSVRKLKNEQQELLDRVSVVLGCLEHAAGAHTASAQPPSKCEKNPVSLNIWKVLKTKDKMHLHIDSGSGSAHHCRRHCGVVVGLWGW
jgi:hypothetical protein